MSVDTAKSVDAAVRFYKMMPDDALMHDFLTVVLNGFHGDFGDEWIKIVHRYDIGSVVTKREWEKSCGQMEIAKRLLNPGSDPDPSVVAKVKELEDCPMFPPKVSCGTTWIEVVCFLAFILFTIAIAAMGVYFMSR